MKHEQIKEELTRKSLTWLVSLQCTGTSDGLACWRKMRLGRRCTGTPGGLASKQMLLGKRCTGTVGDPSRTSQQRICVQPLAGKKRIIVFSELFFL
jgi:hypothetical protein